MQYPQIQFYRGSLVRLANGQLKQVENLSSDDFIESARLAASKPDGRGTLALHNNNQNAHHLSRFNFQQLATGHNNLRPSGGSSGTLDENNNSVFNSPEPTSAGYDDSPRMEAEEYDEEEEIDVELDVVTNEDLQPVGRQKLCLNLSDQTACERRVSGLVNPTARQANGGTSELAGDFYVDSSVVRDFLEVGPIQQQLQQRLSATANPAPPLPGSPASSTGSLSQQEQQLVSSRPSTSSSQMQQSTSISSPASVPQIMSAAPASTSQTVLIKFFLETSRSIAFIEVPIEHPFFVLHRGWSSWNPQMTYETFGLKCRKLKIGDTCISLIKKRRKQANSHNDSDQCNILFSSIRINE